MKRSTLIKILIVTIFTNILTLGFCVSNMRMISSLKRNIDTQTEAIAKQKKTIRNLDKTKDVRNYETIRKMTNEGIKGATYALYNWNGHNFADRYDKAEKYMDRSVLKQISTNGQIPSKDDMEQTGKDYASIHAENKVTTLQNGIQDINGNEVTGFVWITSKFTSDGSSMSQEQANYTSTQQVKYKYNVATKKFTEYNVEPFSGTIEQ